MTDTAAAPHRDEDTVVQMLCLRNDELEREKEALAAKLDRAEDTLRRVREERAMAIQQAVKRARMEWAREDKAELDRLKAEWQAEALELAAEQTVPVEYAHKLLNRAKVIRRQAEGGE